MLYFIRLERVRSSVGERFLDAEEAVGSIPTAPTTFHSHSTFWLILYMLLKKAG